MSLRFLFDECLSPQLVAIAREAGHHESTCVRDMGWLGMKDHVLIRRVVDGDFTLVTCNTPDFRGKDRDTPGGWHSKEPIHAGLVCINGHHGDVERAKEMLRLALAYLHAIDDDLVNKALEVTLSAEGQISATLYEIPRP